MINPVAILDIIVVLTVMAAIAGLFIRTKNNFMVSTRLLLGCLLLFLLLYGICLTVEWSGITTQLDSVEDYIGALLPMWWAFVFYAFLHEIDIGNIKALNRELEQRIESIKEAELRFRTIFHSASDGILIAHSGEGTFFSVNEKFCEMLGFTKEELLGLNISDIHPKESIPYVNEQIKRLSAKEISVAQNIPLLKKDQTVFFADVSTSIMTFDKKDYLIGIFRDITERKQAEEKLRKSEANLKTAQSQTHIGSWEVDISNQQEFWSDEMCRIFEFEPDSGQPSFSHLLKRIHPDDIERIDIDFKQAKSEQRSISQQFRIVLTDGSERYIEAHGNPVFDDGGKMIRIVGTSQDITERKKAKENLFKSEKKFSSIFHLNPNPLAITDVATGKFMDINEAFIQWTGFAREEVIGVSAQDLHLWVDSKDRQKIIGILTDSGEANGIEIMMRQKNGHVRNVLFSARFIEIEQTRHLLTLVHDITERKQAEGKLQQSLEQLKRAVNTTIQVLISALEARDPYTAGHQSRSANLACAIAKEMELTNETIEGIRMAGVIHDIGKLSIPAEILSKPTRLTDLEFSLIKQHSQIGYEMLKDVASAWPLAQIVYQHHERMNGTGYPRKLKGDEILLEARILAVADVVEAMASHRPYRPSLGIEAAINEIEKNKGILYDNVAVDACLRLFREKGYELT